MKTWEHSDRFVRRHIGPSPAEEDAMLKTVGFDSLDAMTSAIVPEEIYFQGTLDFHEALSEWDAIGRLREIGGRNQVYRSLIGLGYSSCIVPAVVQRNIMENPGWYTQYTPYQPEIAQGRLEALLNFQTMICELTAMEIANASLLDEGTAVAEAVAMALRVQKSSTRSKFLVSEMCHPQTIEVIKTRAQPAGVEIVVGNPEDYDESYAGVVVQYPDTDGVLVPRDALAERVHASGGLVIAVADLLSLTLVRAPGEWGADIVVGNSQRFGVPLGFGGPHAAFMATRESYRRQMPGRLVGVSIDSTGGRALRLALQTREQHIRRERATSNICTAQVLLAVMASMYGVYHGPDGLKSIAGRIKGLTDLLADGLARIGHSLVPGERFDTISFALGESAEAESIKAALRERDLNVRWHGEKKVGISLDERSTIGEVERLLEVFSLGNSVPSFEDRGLQNPREYSTELRRNTSWMEQEVFHRYRSETEFLRYVHALQAKDLSLTTSMIPLGSCTMKLNATAEMVALSWPEFADIHPFAPADQSEGYRELFAELSTMLAEITGMHGVSLQPNAGSQGEYAGMLVIDAYHRSRGDCDRNICLIPRSAHGTNPASAIMAGMKVVPIECDKNGNMDLDDLRSKVDTHCDRLAAIMVTYPSTHGVFEMTIAEICHIVHDGGGQVYLDGANMNAQVGLCRPGDYGADVCHLNLHKTFAIPHGGGGPGMGPICVAEHLSPYLPGHPLDSVGGECAIGPVSAAPWGSSSILTISWSYLMMLGPDGVRKASQVAILNANYMAKRLEAHYDILYRADAGVAHEFIIDLRPFKASAGIEVIDLAKRLMDYGFHAPTMSWPVAGTMMIEPTESESKTELDRFCDAMIAIRREIADIESNESDRANNPLKNAPHTARFLVQAEWNHPYTRETAVFPMGDQGQKFWPSVARVNDAHGDRNLICTCPQMDEF
jgi:glycine dehydrogenase